MAIAISDKCAEIMMSNVRPKAEPIIIAKSTNPDGTVKTIEWKPKDIKSLTFKYEIDPIGRTLPYMELVWTEVYNENLDFEKTKKYLSASKYMAVNFTIEQKLGFYNNWETLYSAKKTWKELFDTKTTWKQLKNDVASEIISFPTLFLEDKPKLQGLTITWTARDFLYYLDSPISRTIGADGEDGPTFFAFPQKVLDDESNRLSNYKEISNIIKQAAEKVYSYKDGNNEITRIFLHKRISVSENSKNALLHYVNIESMYWSFNTDEILKLNFWNRFWDWDLPKNSKTAFYKKTMTKLPQKTKNPTIANFKYKYQTVTPPDDKLEKFEDSVLVNDLGEDFIEDNPLNPYRQSSDYKDIINKKVNFYNDYFDSNAVVLDFECLPNFELVPGDIVAVQSNDFYTNGNPIMYEGILVSQTLTYNGAFKQKNIVHEINAAIG